MSEPGPQRRLFELVRERMEANPACHDYDHTLRVYRTALEIAEGEGADREVVSAAALLHDIARDRELEEGSENCHARLGAEETQTILAGCGFEDRAFIARVAACVASHRYRRRPGQEPPASPEERAVFDADKLDGMGAVGIARAFHFAGRIGARLHNSPEAALESDPYSREDTAYREYLIKLRRLEDTMLTATGRRLARERSEFMDEFFRRLCAETGTGFPAREED